MSAANPYPTPQLGLASGGGAPYDRLFVMPEAGGRRSAHHATLLPRALMNSVAELSATSASKTTASDLALLQLDRRDIVVPANYPATTTTTTTAATANVDADWAVVVAALDQLQARQFLSLPLQAPSEHKQARKKRKHGRKGKHDKRGHKAGTKGAKDGKHHEDMSPKMKKAVAIFVAVTAGLVSAIGVPILQACIIQLWRSMPVLVVLGAGIFIVVTLTTVSYAVIHAARHSAPGPDPDALCRVVAAHGMSCGELTGARRQQTLERLRKMDPEMYERAMNGEG
jgi:hypothetical protein